MSIVVIKKQQMLVHTWRRRRRTASSAAVAALRSTREREKERDRERERKRDSSERRCNGLAMEGDGAIGVDCRASCFAQNIFYDYSHLCLSYTTTYCTNILPTTMLLVSLLSLITEINDTDSRATRNWCVGYGMTSFGGLLEKKRRKGTPTPQPSANPIFL